MPRHVTYESHTKVIENMSGDRSHRHGFNLRSSLRAARLHWLLAG